FHPVAEQALFVGAQGDGQVLDRNPEFLVGLEAREDAVGVLVGVSGDVRVGGEEAAEDVGDDRVEPVRVTRGRVLVRRGLTTSMLSARAVIVHRCQPSDRALPGVPPSIATLPSPTPWLRVSAKLSPRAHRSSPTTVV